MAKRAEQTISKKDWWKTLFTAEIGNVMFGKMPHAKTVREVEQVLMASKTQPKRASILDLGCGIGRHSIEFAKRGFEVVGLDYSKAYLIQANAEKKYARLNDNLQFIHGDMRKLDRHFETGRFDLVVSMYNSFGYFDDRKDDLQVLKQVARVLKPGGALVLNTLNRPAVEYRLVDLTKKANLPGFYRWEERKTGSFFLDRATYDSKRCRTWAEWIIVDAGRGKMKRFTFGQNVYSHEEFVSLLKPLGLKVEKKWGRLDGGERFHQHAWHQTFVARKLK